METVLQILTSGLLMLKALRRSKPISLQNKVVIVTGASAGIGRATARAFAAAGANVVLAARRVDLLEALKTELKPYDRYILVVATDVSNDDDLERLVSETLRALGRIDVLVNNAGLGRGGALHEMDGRDIEQMLQVNLYGAFRLTQLVLPTMLRQKSGHIINVSSVAALFNCPGMSVYSATKSGISAFSNCLRRELADSGVCVSTVTPAPVKTALTESALNAYTHRQGRGTWPKVMKPFVDRIDEPETLGKIIVDAVRYQKREVRTGGLPAGVAIGIEKLVPRFVDLLLSGRGRQSLIAVSEKFGK